MKVLKALSFGEILWDIIDREEHLGGAPFNVAAHLAKMGADSFIVSSVGKDRLGSRALNRADTLGVHTDYISSHPEFPTGTVKVSLREGQPSYIIHENSAWDAIRLPDERFKSIIETRWDAFCFGTLAQRTKANRSLLCRLWQSLKDCELFYDVNLRQHYYNLRIAAESMQNCTILKLNEEEMITIAEGLFKKRLGKREFCRRVTDTFAIKIVIITRGASGADAYYEDRLIEEPGVQIDLVDTVGSGDSFGAGFLYCWLNQSPIESCLKFACQIGAFVASRTGAIPDYSPEILEALTRISHKRFMP